MRTRRFLLVGLLVFIAHAGFTQSTGTPTGDRLVGAVYTPPVPAADFTLIDQHGTPFHMAALKGEVVVFSFIYTHCEDVCPYIALKLKAAREMLGDDADSVGFVAVSTDPERDTAEVIASYSREIGLFDVWHFVTGPLSQVRTVWKRYLANVVASGRQESTVTGGSDDSTDRAASIDSEDYAQGLSDADKTLARRIISRFGGGYEVAHFAAFHIIDRKGLLRVTLDQDASPDEIVANVRILLGER